MTTGNQSFGTDYSYTNVQCLELEFFEYLYGVKRVSDQAISGRRDSGVTRNWNAPPFVPVTEVRFESVSPLSTTAGEEEERRSRGCKPVSP